MIFILLLFMANTWKAYIYIYIYVIRHSHTESGPWYITILAFKHLSQQV